MASDPSPDMLPARAYRADTKDHYFVVPPAPYTGIVVVGDRLVKLVPRGEWAIYDRRTGPGWGSLVFSGRI